MLCRCFGNARMMQGDPPLRATGGARDAAPDPRRARGAGSGAASRGAASCKGTGAMVVAFASSGGVGSGCRRAGAGHQRPQQPAARLVDRHRRRRHASPPTRASASSARGSTPRRCSSWPKSWACRCRRVQARAVRHVDHARSGHDVRRSSRIPRTSIRRTWRWPAATAREALVRLAAERLGVAPAERSSRPTAWCASTATPRSRSPTRRSSAGAAST